MTEPQRTSEAYRRDLLLARQVIAQLRDQAMEADEALPRRGPGPGRRRPRCPLGRPRPGGHPLLACGRPGTAPAQCPHRGETSTPLVEGVELSWADNSTGPGPRSYNSGPRPGKSARF